MIDPVRVRFAPSPTGPLHIGGLRTALFNYLFAKKHQGTFVLRIEDTDQKRFVEGAENYIVDALQWCGIAIDEGPGIGGEFGPYRQSERGHIYREHIESLVQTGRAYYAFDTAEELDALRQQYQEKGDAFIYNWKTRSSLKNSQSLSKEETDQLIASGTPYVVRFKMFEPGATMTSALTITDRIRGHVQFDMDLLDDKVIFKSDGLPTYHLANVVDDHKMKITHVIRGEEWLPSLPLHVALYQALGWNPPEFAHLPLILKPTGKGKLSKRDAEQGGFPIFPLTWTDPHTGAIASGYRESGYLPEALINFLALLGWNPGTEQECFTLSELIHAFDLDRVNKSGARFDHEKIKWFNHHYIQQYTTEALAAMWQNADKRVSDVDIRQLSVIVDLIKERVNLISDFWDQGALFFEAPSTYDEKATKKAFKPGADGHLEHVQGIIDRAESSASGVISALVKSYITSNNIPFGAVMMPLRVALVGALKGPDIFEIISVLGKEESSGRIRRAISYIQSKV